MRLSIDELSRSARAVFPDFVFCWIRRFGTALLTPFLFSAQTGHFKSSLLGKAVSRTGTPLPWYTYPAVDFLDGKDLSGKRVLEFGAGQSTLWWAGKAAQVVSFEHDPEWVARLISHLPPSVQLHRVPWHLEGIERLLPSEPFDVVVIDGLNRLKCAHLSLRLVAPGGAILLDNSEGSWGGEKDETYPILDLFRERGFQRVDFFGYTPGVIRPHCTSLFCKAGCFLLAGQEPPRK